MELKTCEKINKGKGKIITWKGVLHDNIELIKVGSKFDSEAHGGQSTKEKLQDSKQKNDVFHILLSPHNTDFAWLRPNARYHV